MKNRVLNSPAGIVTSAGTTSRPGAVLFNRTRTLLPVTVSLLTVATMGFAVSFSKIELRFNWIERFGKSSSTICILKGTGPNPVAVAVRVAVSVFSERRSSTVWIVNCAVASLAGIRTLAGTVH